MPTLRGNCEGNIAGLSVAYVGLFRAPSGDFFALDSHKYDLATTARHGYTPSGSELIGVTYNGIFRILRTLELSPRWTEMLRDALAIRQRLNTKQDL